MKKDNPTLAKAKTVLIKNKKITPMILDQKRNVYK